MNLLHSSAGKTKGVFHFHWVWQPDGQLWQDRRGRHMPTASLMPASPTTEDGAEQHRPHSGGHQVISRPLSSHGTYGRHRPLSPSCLSAPPLASSLTTTLILGFSTSFFLDGGLTWSSSLGRTHRWLVCSYLSWCLSFAARPDFMDPAQWHVLEMKSQR